MFENIEIFLLFIKVAWLQNCGVFMENKSKIMQYMDETYEYRKYQIANVLLTPTAINCYRIPEIFGCGFWKTGIIIVRKILNNI